MEQVQDRKVVAIERIENAFSTFEDKVFSSMHQLVTHLVEKVTPNEDGKRKIFHATTYDDIRGLVTKYQALKASTNEDLDQAINVLEGCLKKFDVEGIRASKSVREQAKETFSELAQSLAVKVKTRKIKGAEEGGEDRQEREVSA